MAPKRKKRKTLVIVLEKNWLLIIWISINCYAFYYTYSQYKGKPEYYYLRMILGTGLCISRGSATVININCCLILLPICRALNSLVCTIISKFYSKNILLFWLQNTKRYHIAIAMTITFSSVIHTFAHIQNAINFSINYDENHKIINWAAFKNENPVIMVMRSLTGLTGVIMLVIIIILTISSSTIIRRRNYNLFWYTHNICYLFLFMFLIHPLSGVLKEQINVDKCIGNASMNISRKIEGNAKCQEPEFGPIRTQGWLWVLLPTFLYVLDYIFRILRRNNGMVCVMGGKRMHDGVIITLSLPYAKFVVKPGEFVLLNCPMVSHSEWHPFTVTKCPLSSQNSFQVLVHARGDWSKKLHALEFNCDNVLYKWPPPKPIRLYVDGPYSSPMEEIVKSRIVIGIAAGVGVTPFMSSLWNLLTKEHSKIPEKIHLIWIVKNILQIEWSSNLFLAFHNKCWRNNEPDRFSFSIYVTNQNEKYSMEQAKNTIIRRRLHLGRPNWYNLFSHWESLHPSQKRYVFTCGPKSLNNQIKKFCSRFKNYHYIHESFS